jgi:hypothetical protein
VQSRNSASHKLQVLDAIGYQGAELQFRCFCAPGRIPGWTSRRTCRPSTPARCRPTRDPPARASAFRSAMGVLWSLDCGRSIGAAQLEPPCRAYPFSGAANSRRSDIGGELTGPPDIRPRIGVRRRAGRRSLSRYLDPDASYDECGPAFLTSSETCDSNRSKLSLNRSASCVACSS